MSWSFSTRPIAVTFVVALQLLASWTLDSPTAAPSGREERSSTPDLTRATRLSKFTVLIKPSFKFQKHVATASTTSSFTVSFFTGLSDDNSAQSPETSPTSPAHLLFPIYQDLRTGSRRVLLHCGGNYSLPAKSSIRYPIHPRAPAKPCFVNLTRHLKIETRPNQTSPCSNRAKVRNNVTTGKQCPRDTRDLLRRRADLASPGAEHGTSVRRDPGHLRRSVGYLRRPGRMEGPVVKRRR